MTPSPVNVACHPRILSRDVEPKTQRAHDPHDGRKGRISARRQRLVEALMAHAHFARETGHVPGTCHLVQSGADQAAITRILVGACLHVELCVLKRPTVFGGVPLLNLSVISAYIP